MMWTDCFERTGVLLTVVMLLAVLWSPALFAQQSSAAPPASLRILQQRPDRLVVELPNRLIVIAQEVRTAPVVSAQVWVKTGSIYEQQHVGAGLSHYLEHLLAGGSTSNRTEDETSAIIGRIGAETNAATSLDTVHYYINTLSEHAPVAIELLSDWMQHAKIEQKEFDRERDVIRREFEQGTGDPPRILWKLTQQARFQAHPARHPTIGYIEDFLKITREEIVSFYKTMYVPNNMVFVVVGDIDKQKVVQQIAGLWSQSKAADLPELSFPVETTLPEDRNLTEAADVRAPRIRLAWPGTRLGKDGDYALDLLAVILGGGESSRLVRSVRNEQQLVNAISAFNFSSHWGEGFFSIDAEVTLPPAQPGAAAVPVADVVEKARAAILDQVKQLQVRGVTQEELARAKRQVLARVVYEAQDVEGLANRLAQDTIAMADPDYLAAYAKAIDRVTAKELAAAADQYLTSSKIIGITLIPAAKDQKLRELTRPTGGPSPKSFAQEPVLLDNIVLSEKIEARKPAGGSDALPAVVVEPVQRFMLTNGLRVLVQRNTAVPAVSIHLYHAGGLLADEPGREGVTNAVAAMLTRGTTTRTADQIATLTDDLGADLDAKCGSNSSYTQLLCLKPDWPAMLDLLADVTLNPAFPDDEWQRMRQWLLAGIARQQDTWMGELRLRFNEAYFGNHPWSSTPLGRAEVVSSLTPDVLRQWHRDHLSAEQSVLAVFGDVDPQQVLARAEAAFASMPRSAAKPVVLKAAEDPRPRIVQVQTQKPLAAVQVGMGPGVPRRSADYAPLQVLAKVLSDFPAGWLEAELRGKGPGLAYAVWAQSSAGLIPGYTLVGFNTQPQQVPLALSRTLSVVSRAKSELVDEVTLTRAKAAVLADETLRKQTNSDRAMQAALDELYNLPADAVQQFRDQVHKVDAALLQQVARLYLRNPVIVVLTNQTMEPAELEKAVLAP